ncbi:hypothetical protein GR254_23010, partial [Mycobacterium tuberculosis]|nr:hypothetical protein [Mycobacterium tuberculosis]
MTTPSIAIAPSFADEHRRLVAELNNKLAAARRSATETQRWVPSRSTQVAREISANMPG